MFSNALRPNLVEIHHAFETKEKESNTLALFAYDDYTVYSEKTLQGRVISFFFARSSLETTMKTIVHTIFYNAITTAYSARLDRATHWIQRLEESDAPENRFKDFLQEELNESIHKGIVQPYLINFQNKKLTPVNPQAIKNEFLDAFESISFFWKSYLKNNKLKKYLKDYLTETSLIKDQPLYKILKKEHRYYQIESVLKQKTPVELLTKIDQYDDHFKVGEKQCIKQWVEGLNSHPNDIPIKHIFYLLEEIGRINQVHKKITTTLVDLICWLGTNECSRMSIEDENEVRLRAEIAPGNTIKWNGMSITLGEELEGREINQQKLTDIFRVFEISKIDNQTETEDTKILAPGDHVIKFPHNRFLSLLFRYSHQKEQWGVRFNSSIIVEKSGSYIIEEKLKMLKDYQWKTNEWALQKDSDEQQIVMALASLFFFAHNNNRTINNQSIHSLGRDSTGMIRSTYLNTMGEGNYNEWEAQAIETAQGNPFILKLITSISKLDQHPVALYYRTCLRKVFETGQLGFNGIHLINKHDKECYQTHRDKLAEKAEEIRSACIKTVRAKLQQKPGKSQMDRKKASENEISSALIQCYTMFPMAGTLDAEMKDKMIDHCFKFYMQPGWDFSKGSNLELNEQIVNYIKNNFFESPMPSDEYYDGMHRVMMELNERAYEEEFSLP